MTTPSPRSRAARRGVFSHGPFVALLVVALVAILAACGSGVRATPPPAGSADLATPGPSPSPWPVSVVEAVLALGAADAEIWKAGADIARAADAKDVEAMWGAADGTVTLLEGLSPNIETLESYPHTAELGAAYRAAFPVMIDGATQLRDSITNGDAAGVVAGSQTLAKGVKLYASVRAILEPYVKEASEQKRHLVQ